MHFVRLADKKLRAQFVCVWKILTGLVYFILKIFNSFRPPWIQCIDHLYSLQNIAGLTDLNFFFFRIASSDESWKYIQRLMFHCDVRVDIPGVQLKSGEKRKDP